MSEGTIRSSEIHKKNTEKKRMLESVYGYLATFIIRKEDEQTIRSILDAMKVIDRKHYVDNPDYAYHDSAIPIGEGQSISQPSTVARMLYLADLQKKDDVLEVGSASGWNASLISQLVSPGKVFSIELLNALTKKAKQNTAEMKARLEKKHPEAAKKLDQVTFSTENLFSLVEQVEQGFDAIIITAGITPYQEQTILDIAAKLLKNQGTLVCPYTAGPLLIAKKDNGNLAKAHTAENYAFVPLLEH